MNIALKVFWNNNPIPFSDKIKNPDVVINVPFGAMITHPSYNGGIYSVNGKTSTNIILNAQDVGAASEEIVEKQIDTLNSALDQFYTSLSEEIDTKSNSASVTQLLSTKADLVDGVIPAAQLPSFVDDVLEFQQWSLFPALGESGKIYLDTTENKAYRWSGTTYVAIGGGGVALGETAATAYRGDRGKAAYDHSLSQGNPHNTTTSDINEGSKLYFTESRVQSTLISGLTNQPAESIQVNDQVITALGKLQAQLDLNSKSSFEWINIKLINNISLGYFVESNSTEIELALVDDQLWMRGYLQLSFAPYATYNEILTVSNNKYKLSGIQNNRFQGQPIHFGQSTVVGNTPYAIASYLGYSQNISALWSLIMLANSNATSGWLPARCIGTLT